jgi:hypothetical protein
MSNLILKYNISEKDLYALGLIETKKKSAGYLEKEKLKAASLKILKPYNVKFMDIGGISGEIKQGGFDNKYSDSISQEEKLAIEKMIQENSNVSKFFKEFWDGKSKKQKWIIVIAVLFVFGFIGSVTDDKTSSSNSNSGVGSDSKITKVTFSEAEAFMQNRCNSTNQTLMKKKSVNFNGTKLYMFLSVAENGYVCISSVSENALEVLAADCGPSEIKIEEWNAVN